MTKVGNTHQITEPVVTLKHRSGLIKQFRYIHP